MGPGRRSINGDIIPISVKEGDKVLLPEYGGTSVKLEESEYVGCEVAWRGAGIACVCAEVSCCTGLGVDNRS